VDSDIGYQNGAHGDTSTHSDNLMPELQAGPTPDRSPQRCPAFGCGFSTTTSLPLYIFKGFGSGTYLVLCSQETPATIQIRSIAPDLT
jgi:hypothetical protein